MKRARRFFSPEFKAEAVKLIKERGYSVSQACRELDIGETALRRWISQVVTTLKSRGIKRLCALFEVSESAYYAQCKAVKTPQKHTALSVEIKSLFVESRGSAGKRTLRDLYLENKLFVGL